MHGGKRDFEGGKTRILGKGRMTKTEEVIARGLAHRNCAFQNIEVRKEESMSV